MITEAFVNKILADTDYVRKGGTDEELKAAQYLQGICQELGAEAHLENFEVQMTHMNAQHLYADGVELPCLAFRNCGSWDVEAPLIYLPNTDKTSMMAVKDKIVLLDINVTHFLYQDLYAAGAKGIICAPGNAWYADDAIDQRELRAYVSLGKKLPCLTVNPKTAIAMVRDKVKTARIVIDQNEYMGQSRNVVAEIPGLSDEYVVLSAHYDSTHLSHGAYDNMSGCIGILGVMEELIKTAPHRYGMKFVFCGSEERGLLGSKAYVAAHEDELDKIALNINLDMIGSIMGKFLACCSCEEKLANYIAYMASEMGWGIHTYQGVYSSDSTPFADKGVPSLSFARMAADRFAPIHWLYDTMEEVCAEHMVADTEFITAFTRRMVDAVRIPVSREIPEKVKTQLDEYMLRKRKSN